MNIIYSLIVVVTLSLISFSSVAKTITAVGSTIDSTEKEISLQAKNKENHIKFWARFLRIEFI